MEQGEYLLELKGMRKAFGAVQALKNGNFNLRRGEIHAIIGENGAGKSTLMKIIGGIYSADEGEISFKGKQYSNLTSRQAMDLGIGIVHQEFMLVKELSVLENIILGKEPRKGLARIDYQKAEEALKLYIRDFGFAIRLHERVRDIPVGEAQRVEIVKTLYRGAKVIILDEPTAVLTPQESQMLFRVIQRLKEAGTSIVFISHKLGEVMQISDRITVMRAGDTVATVDAGNTDRNKLAALMLGKTAFDSARHTESYVDGPVFLEVQNLFVPGDRELSKIREMSFSVRKGEILGFAGVDGNGQTELAEALIGLRKPDCGRIVMGGRDITALSVQKRRALHIGFIPENRNTGGLWRERSIRENIMSLPVFQKKMSKCGIIDKKRTVDYSIEASERFDVRPAGVTHLCKSLSGGNAQKVVIARELSQPLELLIAAQPTRGVDVGSIEAIQGMLRQAAKSGTSIVLISTELEEILSLSDRIIVLYEGRIAGQVNVADTNEEELGLLMTGGKVCKNE